MLSGIGQGMEKGANVIYSIMISIISKLIAIAVAKFIILSPSKLTAGWGENIVKGIAVGMEGQRRGLERTWLSVLDTITPPDPMSMSAVAGAAPIAPQIVVDMTGVTLFGDPAGEARKIGSQVFLREGMLVAREGGFGG